MIALISPANNHPLLKKDQSYDAFIKSYCNFGFGGRVGLFDFCGQLGRACITWLLRAASCSSPSWFALSSSLSGMVRPSASLTASVSTADRQSVFLAGLDARIESAQI
jgi:hypothetical protein